MDSPTTAIIRNVGQVGRLVRAREPLRGLVREVGDSQFREVSIPEPNQLLIELPFRGELEVGFVKHETSCFGASIQIALDWA